MVLLVLKAVTDGYGLRLRIPILHGAGQMRFADSDWADPPAGRLTTCSTSHATIPSTLPVPSMLGLADPGTASQGPTRRARAGADRGRCPCAMVRSWVDEPRHEFRMRNAEAGSHGIAMEQASERMTAGDAPRSPGWRLAVGGWRDLESGSERRPMDGPHSGRSDGMESRPSARGTSEQDAFVVPARLGHGKGADAPVMAFIQRRRATERGKLTRARVRMMGEEHGRHGVVIPADLAGSTGPLAHRVRAAECPCLPPELQSGDPRRWVRRSSSRSTRDAARLDR